MECFVKYSPWIAIAIMAIPLAAEFFFWCFCKVENYFQKRFVKKILKNMEKLDQIIADSEKKANAA